MTTQAPPIAVDEYAAAQALGFSVGFLRNDRRTARVFPFYKVNTAVRYNLDRCREALAAMEEGGPKSRAKKA